METHMHKGPKNKNTNTKDPWFILTYLEIEHRAFHREEGSSLYFGNF